jgi:DNA (cytosine-5)-methyltransferase 1
MRYFSCFSGIEAASVAWEPLGWTPVGFSEIDPFASAVLAHRFPNVRNYGDITKHHEWDIGRGSVDVLVGGSPCQAFSVAGLRKGLDDPRGQLTLVYLQLAARLEPEWIVWENVPGVLSADGGRAFGAFLGGLAELGYGFAWRVLDARFFGVPQRRRRVFLVARRAGDWQRPGEVLLEPAGLCWNPAESGEARQEVARAASDGARASGIVYGGSDQRYSDTVTSKWAKQSGGPAGNETGLFVAHPDVPDVMSTLDGQSGGQSLCNQFVDSGCCIPGEVKPIAFGQGSFAQYVEGECSTLRAAGGDLGGGSENIVVQPTAIQGNLIGRDQGGPQGVGCSDSGTMYTLTRGDVHGVAIPIQDGREIEKSQNGFGVGDAGDPAYTLDTTGAQSIAFSQNQREEVRILGDCAGALSGPGTHQATYVAQAADVRTGRLVGEISGTICAKGSGGWSNHMINPVLVPHAFYSTGGTHGLESKPDVCPPLKVGSTIGIPSPPSVMYTLDMQGCKGNANVGDGSVSPTLGRPSGTDCHAVAYGIDGEMNASESIIGPLKRGGEGGRNEAVAIPTAMVVRRLLPVECERLQGFPDGWTDVPYRGKPAPDGPRYKALGNSMAVPCMAWIGRRIQFAKESEQ